jgi:hypothetical protein
MYRVKVGKKLGLNTYEFRYGKGCQCSWLDAKVRVPLDKSPDQFIRDVVKAIEQLEKS